jgi:hypothetical protein
MQSNDTLVSMPWDLSDGKTPGLSPIKACYQDLWETSENPYPKCVTPCKHDFPEFYCFIHDDDEGSTGNVWVNNSLWRNDTLGIKNERTRLWASEVKYEWCQWMGLTARSWTMYNPNSEDKSYEPICYRQIFQTQELWSMSQENLMNSTCDDVCDSER